MGHPVECSPTMEDIFAKIDTVHLGITGFVSDHYEPPESCGSILGPGNGEPSHLLVLVSLGSWLGKAQRHGVVSLLVYRLVWRSSGLPSVAHCASSGDKLKSSPSACW